MHRSCVFVPNLCDDVRTEGMSWFRDKVKLFFEWFEVRSGLIPHFLIIFLLHFAQVEFSFSSPVCVKVAKFPLSCVILKCFWCVGAKILKLSILFLLSSGAGPHGCVSEFV